MTGFVIWAALCAAAAALFVAAPLLRARPDGAPRHGIPGIAAALVLALGAALLYPRWSNWSWQGAPAAQGEGIAALLAAAQQHPDEAQGWVNLGRGYLRIAQWPLARRSFQRADRLSHGGNAAALSGLAETIVFENNGRESAAADTLFNRALQLDPHSPQALFYTGIALLNAGDLGGARARFAAFRELGPPPQVLAALDKQIAAIDVEMARRKPDPATAIHLLLRLAPQLAGRVPAGASLFVFVRAPQGGPPLAARRLKPELPQRVDLSAADSMIEGNRLKPGQQVQVMARISASGAPTGGAGDLSGALTAIAGAAGLRELAIDRITP
jgi:cytochrome c-type biogenesis protein CcmH